MPQKQYKIKTLHSMPGRVRLRAPFIVHSRAAAEKVGEYLLAKDGIEWIKCNPACSSLTVGFSSAKISAGGILGLLKAFPPAAPPKKAPAESCTARRRRHGKPTPANPVKRAAIRFMGLSLVVAGTFVKGTILKLAVGQSLLSPLGIVAAVSTWPLVRKSIEDVRSKRFGLDGFLAGSILTAVAMGEAMTALEILWIDSGAEFLTAWINQRSRTAIADILQVTAKNTFISVDGREVEVPVEEVRPGDLVVLHTGEKVSVDGAVESGRAMLDESPINGRSEFILKQKGDQVLAGTLVREGVIFVRAEKVGDQTYLSRIIHMVEDALENQAPIQGVADQLAMRLLKLGGFLTLGTLLVTRSFWRAFTVLLVMACPCATVLSASAPISAAIHAAARRKILIKGGRYLEEASRADTICFDKTGTLTIAQPTLRRLVNLSDRPDEELLQLAYTAEVHNFHPLAMAIKQAAEDQGVKAASHVVCQYHLGQGVSARLNGKSIYVGNRRFMERQKVAVNQSRPISKGLEEKGLTVAFLALDDELLGVMGFANQTRPEAAGLVQMLSEDGVSRLVMITGEEGCTASTVARELGMDDCHYSVMPENKAEIVSGLSAPGHKVLMVGDGINDALALAEADVGIAMGAGGSEVAIEAADIALVTDDLNGVAYVRSLSRSTLKIVKQNFWIATGSNLAGMAVGALGLLSPVAAGLLHIVHTVGILANSSRVLYHRHPAIQPGKPACLATAGKDGGPIREAVELKAVNSGKT